LTSPAEASSSKSLVLIAFVLAIAGLYFGRHLFIPLALAFVFSFLLTPLVSLLEKIHVGRVPAVLAVLALSFVAVGALTWITAKQVVQIMTELPDYKENLDEKVRSLRSPGSGSLSRATATVQELNKELASVPGQVAAAKQDKEQRTTRPVKPIPVQVAQPPSNLVKDLQELLGPLATPLQTAAIVIILTLFMLVKREDLRNRAIRLAGRSQLRQMTEALDDAGQRLSRYLLLQFAVNACYGSVFGMALYLIGVPHAMLWGVLAGVLRFVPYLGMLIGAALPIALALAVFPGWHHAGVVFLVFVVLEVSVSNFVEPLLYGAHTGISSLAILVAAVFWATIWGGIGLILSTPLTVCLVVLGRHVPQLKFLEVVLSDEPVLLPEQCFYQRLLARDEIEARGIAQKHLRENSLESLYESVILPALKLAENDDQAEGLEDATRRFIYRTVKELIEDLGDEYEENDGSSRIADQQIADQLEQDRQRSEIAAAGNIACIAAGNGADHLVATMLAQLLRRSGFHAEEFRAGLPDAILPEIARGDYSVACLSSISPYSVGDVRSLCKRLRASNAGLQVLLGLWCFENDAARQRLGPACPVAVVSTLTGAISEIRRLANPVFPVETLAHSGASSK
jgi:predicted PurR-regulated permease PerM